MMVYLYMASYTYIKLYQESINKGKFEKNSKLGN